MRSALEDCNSIYRVERTVIGNENLHGAFIPLSSPEIQPLYEVTARMASNPEP